MLHHHTHNCSATVCESTYFAVQGAFINEWLGTERKRENKTSLIFTFITYLVFSSWRDPSPVKLPRFRGMHTQQALVSLWTREHAITASLDLANKPMRGWKIAPRSAHGTAVYNTKGHNCRGIFQHVVLAASLHWVLNVAIETELTCNLVRSVWLTTLS